VHRFFLNWSCAAIGEKYDINERTVRKWMRRFENGKERLTTDGRKGRSINRNAKLKAEHHAYLSHLMTFRSDMYLDELAAALFEHFNIWVSLSTICRTLLKLGYTRKVVLVPSGHAKGFSTLFE
jgi:transposase